MVASEGSRKAWLFLLSQGGWWTAQQVAACNPDWPTRFVSSAALSSALRNLASSGMLVRRMPVGGNAHEYAVMPQCGVIQGVKLSELMEALHAPPQKVLP